MPPWKWHQVLVQLPGNHLWVPSLFSVYVEPALSLGPYHAVQNLKQEHSTWAHWASHQKHRALLNNRAKRPKFWGHLESSALQSFPAFATLPTSVPGWPLDQVSMSCVVQTRIDAALQLLTKSYIWFRSEIMATLPLESTRYWNARLSKSSDCCNSCYKLRQRPFLSCVEKFWVAFKTFTYSGFQLSPDETSFAVSWCSSPLQHVCQTSRRALWVRVNLWTSWGSSSQASSNNKFSLSKAEWVRWPVGIMSAFPLYNLFCLRFMKVSCKKDHSRLRFSKQDFSPQTGTISFLGFGIYFFSQWLKEICLLQEYFLLSTPSLASTAIACLGSESEGGFFLLLHHSHP